MISFRRPKKPNRPTRVITTDPDAEDEEMDDLPQSLATISTGNSSNGNSNLSEKVKPSVNVKSGKESKKKEDDSSKKQPPLLSFDEELEGDDGEVFKIKKSSVSRRLMKQRDREKKEAKHGQKNENKDYDEGYYRSTPFSKDTKIKIEHFAAEIQIKPGFTGLKKEMALANKSNDNMRILNGREAEAVHLESEDEEEDDGEDHKFRRPTANAIHEAVRRVLDKGQIPDANLIHEARKRKQMVREMGGSTGPDFIPVDNVNRYRTDSSRLVRDDDNDNSGDDEERIELSLVTNAEKIDRDRRREAFNAALDEEKCRSSEDSDPEIGEWEKQQIRKGVSQAQMYNVAKEAFQQGILDQPQEHLLMQQPASSYNVFPFTSLSEPVPSTSAAATSVTVMQVDAKQKEISIQDIISGNKKLTPEQIIKQLVDRLEKLKLSRERNEGALDRLKAEMVIVEQDLKEANAAKPALSSRFELYQNLRGYVTDLVDCLRCKVPIIESLENRIIELMEVRQNRLAERRRQDVRDQLEEVNSTIQILSGTPVTIPPPGVGEVKSRRAAEREGRRTRRRRMRELKNIRGHKDGLSSDDEEIEMEVNAYKSQREAIMKDTNLVFEDVNEDFSTVAGVLERFEEWRDGDFESYRESYAYMCVPKCIAPFIRLHVLTWDPLTDGFEMMKFPWLKTLGCFGLDRSPSIAKLTTDPDLRLIPSVAEKVLVPWIIRVVKAKWDPTSASQTRKLVNVTKQLITEWYVGPNSKPMHLLMTAILSKFQESVELDVYMPLFPANVLSNKCSPASVFASRQYWSSVKLLGSMSAWQGLLSDKLLQVLALDALLTRYIQLGIRTAADLGDSAERCSGLINVLPTAWLAKDGQEEVPNGLQQLSRCLVAIVQNADCTITVNRIAIPEIVGLLKKLGCSQEAHMIMKKYS